MSDSMNNRHNRSSMSYLKHVVHTVHELNTVCNKKTSCSRNQTVLKYSALYIPGLNIVILNHVLNSCNRNQKFQI